MISLEKRYKISCLNCKGHPFYKNFYFWSSLILYSYVLWPIFDAELPALVKKLTDRSIIQPHNYIRLRLISIGEEVETEMEIKATKAVLFSILITLLHSYPTQSLELSDYQTLSFSNPNQNRKFTKLAIHNETGQVYIGGADSLYRLDADFTKQETVNTSVSCEEEICPYNYNKILLIDYNGNMLVTCGSASYSSSDVNKRPGTCQTRALDSIAEPVRDDDTPVVPSEMLTTEAILAPGPSNGGTKTLYVAATYDRDRYVEQQVYPITRRVYEASTESAIIFNTERDAFVLLNTAYFPDVPFIIDYVYSFVKKHTESDTDYTYFVAKQRQDFISRDDRKYVSKISRVCQTIDNEFRSYTEITLDCQGVNPVDKYNLIQAAYVGPAGADLASSMGISSGDKVFYGVFAKSQGVDGNVPSSQSALCIYKLEDIEEKFIDGIYGCLNDGGDFRLDYASGTSCPALGVSVLRSYLIEKKNFVIN